MTYFGITHIRLDESGARVSEVYLRPLLSRPLARDFVMLQAGSVVPAHKVADQITGGNIVFVARRNLGQPCFSLADKVRVKPGRYDDIETRPAASLLTLPSL